MDLYFYISKIITPIIIPSNILIFLLTLFFYLAFIKNKFFFRKFFTFIFIIFSVISIFPIGHNLIYFFLEKDFYYSKAPNKVDYIFVPSGSISRIITAISLVNSSSYKGVKIIYSSGIAYLDRNNSKDHETYTVKKLITSSKLSKDTIIFLPEARNTFANFKRLNEFLIEKNEEDSKIILITDAFHMKRSIMINKKFNLDIFTLPSRYITKNGSKGLINSYQNMSVINNLRKFDIFIKEFISTSATRFL